MGTERPAFDEHAAEPEYAAGPQYAAEPEDEEGGDPVCWAHLVCPECGAITTEGHRTGCAAARAASGKVLDLTRDDAAR